MLSRALFLTVLLYVLAACGGDGEPRTAAPGSPSADTSAVVAGDSAAAAPPPATGPGFPAFAADSAQVSDSAAGKDSTAATRSVYTSLAEAECRLVERDAETGATTLRCPGTAGYALLMHDFDARMTVDLIAPGGRTLPLRYSGVITSAFSSLGPRAEWRMRNGAPVALIVRVNAFEDPSVPDRATSYLAVAKITGGQACVTDRITPTTPHANEAARQAADRSASRPCLRSLAEQR
ncbi:hypothetical protein [Longimicrobium sp.]|uniref:hypothetical protein n=1 Tax=Longimicrobium sp. TaxID=2029185 RepID=UPI003B3B9A12